MHRYHTNGTSRTSGVEYTTTVIEAVSVEHKETTRNYDILAAVFTDVLKFMHNDLSMLNGATSDLPIGALTQGDLAKRKA